MNRGFCRKWKSENFNKEVAMKICITSTGNDLSAKIDPRFGRCQNFLFVDIDTLEAEAVQNPAASSRGGAGTKAAQLVADKSAEAVLTENVGPNAYTALEAAGIKIYTGITGTCREAFDLFKQGKVSSVSGPTVKNHSGLS
jgi:predicted Fe-Mo cluster-binding NifX family protein